MKKILVIEDMPMVSHILSLMLEEHDKKAYIFDNAIDALANYKVKKYDAIVTDLNLPGMDGIEFIKNIREIDPDIPIVLCSGFLAEYIDLYKMKDELNIGAIFGKPLRVREFNGTLDALMDKD